MAQTSTADLIEQARCLNSCLPAGYQVPVLISIFAKIAGVSADPNSLIADARCLNSCIPAGMQLSVLIDLANKILAGGGGGGNSCLLSGSGPPVAPPPCDVAIYFDTSAGAPNLGLWVWIQSLGGWTEIIAAGP